MGVERRRQNAGLGLGAVVWLLALHAGAQSEAVPEPDAESKATFYALGLETGRSLRGFALKPEELDHVIRGLRDGALRAEPERNDRAYHHRINILREERAFDAIAAERAASAAYVERVTRSFSGQRIEPGFYLQVLREGRGRAAGVNDVVRIHFHGRLWDGSVFDSSVEDGRPRRVRVGQLPTCLREGLLRMQVGAKIRLVCEPAAGFGDAGTGRVPGGAALDVELQLLAITPVGPGAGPESATP